MASQVRIQNHRKDLRRGSTSREVEPQKVQKAFTLIELLVAISIIGILAGVLLPNFMGARERARDTQRKQDLDQIKKALRLYYNDYQRYPEGEDGNIKGCEADGDQVCSWGGEFSAGSGPTVYMKKLPLGPAGTTEESEYSYEQLDDDNFRISVPMENESDPDMEASRERCGIGTTTPQYVICAD